mmetsp:Transcript_66772/g.145664  ORF Transcript_66772/g.145664 Transcript_66772/m.145664 type:complete len:395 (-) Transcript_66772:83-1267(-)
MTQEGAQCLVCLCPLLGQPVCALRCGHVYHSCCFYSWLDKSKRPQEGVECPQCKKVARAEDMRTLLFEVVQVEQQPPVDAEEVQTFIRASTEARERLREELTEEQAVSTRRLVQASEELAELQSTLADHKRARRLVELQDRRYEEESSELQSELTQSSSRLAELQASVDSQVDRLHRKLPVPQARERDADLLEERRRLKLRTVRASDRARQLHEALISARRQQAEGSISSRERTASSKDAEVELAKLRKLEAKLRRDLEERRRAQADLGISGGASGQLSKLAEPRQSSRTALSKPVGELLAPEAENAGPLQTSSATPGRAEAPLEDAHLLYGASKADRLGVSALGAGVSNARDGAKWGALFGQGRAGSGAGRGVSAASALQAVGPSRGFFNRRI